VGLVDEKGARVITYGNASQNSKQALDGNSVFEIGSVTKVFTATLLADMVDACEVSLNDPISKYLPQDSEDTDARRQGDYARGSGNADVGTAAPCHRILRPKDPRNPYADYSVDQMYAFLSGYSLTRGIGEKYEYSNFGVGLLGHILACVPEPDYETLVRKRICEAARDVGHENKSHA
jgi:CubicO group peptidase (beta-lactamase class C family)